MCICSEWLRVTATNHNGELISFIDIKLNHNNLSKIDKSPTNTHISRFHVQRAYSTEISNSTIRIRLRKAALASKRFSEEVEAANLSIWQK